MLTSLFLVIALASLSWRGIPYLQSTPLFAKTYLTLGIQSIFVALLLTVIQFPHSTVIATWSKYVHSPARAGILIALITIIFLLYPVRVAVVLSIFSIILLETYEGRPSPRRLLQVVLPGSYLFLMLFAVFAYNALAVTLRFGPDFDHILAASDKFLLAGHSVSQLAHAFANYAPEWLFKWSQLTYFSLFPQIGAALIVCALVVDTRYAMRFVSTLATAYLITIVIFFMFPTHSPYYNCPYHSTAQNFEVFRIQESLAQYALARSRGVPLPLQTEYYVAFPCMHLAQPLIVLWFMRGWRRILTLLIFVDILLVFSIVLLEWHYFTDLLGGIGVAVVAIAITESSANRIAHQSRVSLPAPKSRSQRKAEHK